MADKLGISTGKGFVKGVYDEYAENSNSAECCGYLATELMTKPVYNDISRDGLYCVVIKDEDEDENTLYRTMMIYVQGSQKSIVEDALSGYVLVYENHTFTLDVNGFDASNMIQKCYLLCSSWTIG